MQRLRHRSRRRRHKKLRLLENLDSEPEDKPVDSSGNDDDIHNVLKEIAAYLALTILTQEEKLSALFYWKRHCEVYPKLSALANFFLTLSASSVPVKSRPMFSIAGLVKNSRRSSIAPRRLNRLCFVHDNYAKFFPVK